MPVDGTYVVEGEYLVTVERLSATEVRKHVPTTERRGRKPLRSTSCSDEDNVSPKEPKQKTSFIKKLRSSFKSKEKRVPVQKDESADIVSEHSFSENIPIQDLSKSLGGSRTEENDTADEAEELDIDNTDQPISQTKYTLGTWSSPNADPLHVSVDEEKPLLAENNGDVDLDELIRSLESGVYDIPPRSTKSTTTTSTPSICKGSEAGEVPLDLQLSINSCGTSSRNSPPSVEGNSPPSVEGNSPPSVEGNSDIPLPVQYLKLDHDEVSGHEYQILNETAPEIERSRSSDKSGNNRSRSSVNKDEFPFNAKKQISIDVIMFPNNDIASEASESLYYDKVLNL